jgi:undecaprenyl diphosphate synthase
MNSRVSLMIGACVVALGITYGGWLAWKTYSTARRAAYLQHTLANRPLNHLGIIMDGNRRWALKNGYKPWIGHRQGVEPLKTAIKFCIKMGIPHLTVYALSLENLQRPPEELAFLFDVLAKEIAGRELENLVQNGVKISFVGDRAQFPPQLITTINDIEEKSKHNQTLSLNLLFCYGGKQEILQAVRTLCAEQTTLSEDYQTAEQQFDAALWSHNIPPVDLLIRTGGEHRISNFLLFKVAYSEICFLDCYWPNLVERDLVNAVSNFLQAQRRFGK